MNFLSLMQEEAMPPAQFFPKERGTSRAGIPDDSDDSDEESPDLLERSVSSFSNESHEKGRALDLHDQSPIRGYPTPPPPDIESLALDDVDQLLAEEMTRLSLAEREKVLEDLHAIADQRSDEPSPEMRAQRLMEFQEALESSHMIPPIQKGAYDLACRIDASYVQNERLRVMFLRADYWDPCKAALRFTKHFEFKLDLFGQDLLCREITQDDLDPGTLEVLYSDLVQELPLRDRAGRLVSIMMPDPNNGTILQKKRRIFYANMVKIQDEETQIKGLVRIVWVANVGMDRAAVWETANLFAALPTRLPVTHICIPDGKRRTFMNGSALLALSFYALESLTRIRIKSHFGTPTELKKELTTFGIPSFLMDISKDGKVIVPHVNMKWSARRLEERSLLWKKQNLSILPPRTLRMDRDFPPDLHPMNSFVSTQRTSGLGDFGLSTSSDDDSLLSAAIPSKQVNPITSTTPQHHREDLILSMSSRLVATIPSNEDVLLGRGRVLQRHVGNIHFRELIDTRQSVYDAASKTEKTAMAVDLVRLVKTRYHGRFLKEMGSGWIEIPDILARKKVADCFRTTRHRKKQRAKNET